MSEHPKKVVLLDLDGTLTKSDPGIIGCVVKTFMEMGYPVPDDAELHRFIGPAISESLQRNGVPDDKLDEGVRIYRKYYSDEAVFDDPNNPGSKVPGRTTRSIPAFPNSSPSYAPKDTIWQSPAASRNTSAFQFASISIWTPWSMASTVPARTIHASTRTR